MMASINWSLQLFIYKYERNNFQRRYEQDHYERDKFSEQGFPGEFKLYALFLSFLIIHNKVQCPIKQNHQNEESSIKIGCKHN